MTGFSLCLQHPGESSENLLDTLLAAAEGAERGGGIFAFASADGIGALLGSRAFKGLLKSGRFDLVVGVDSVTNRRALDELAVFVEHHENLDAHVFVHEESVLFHPKLSWFVAGKRLTLVIGSGNLTVRGLSENWEAFATMVLEGPSAERVETEFSSWLEVNGPLLRAPLDPVAYERAARNTGRESDLKHARHRSHERVESAQASVLVAEVPKSGGRPSQVNFHRSDYEAFFGAREGSEHSVVLRWVGADGTIGAAEVRPIVIRKSRNFSLELAGFREGRRRDGFPDIGVYVRLPQGTFLYQRLAYRDAGHTQLRRFLDRRWAGPAHHMRRALAPLGEVSAAWPESPLWSAEIPSS